jgi:ribonucleoside-diphosphate reductase alpha chain
MPTKRPDVLEGETECYLTKCGNMYIIINEHEGKIHEVFLKLGKSGACAKHWTELTGRILTTAFKRGAKPEKVIHAIERCDECRGGGGKMDGISCGGAIIEALKRHVKEKEEPIEETTTKEAKS